MSDASWYHHREAQNHSPEHSRSPFLAGGRIFPTLSGILYPCQSSSNNWKCLGYYRNCSSLRAGTRHHRETLRYGNSFPPTFPEDLLAHASPNYWQIFAKHANTTSSRGRINAEPVTIKSESDTERRLAGRAVIRRSPWCLVKAR